MDWLPETTRGRRTGGWSEEGIAMLWAPEVIQGQYTIRRWHGRVPRVGNVRIEYVEGTGKIDMQCLSLGLNQTIAYGLKGVGDKEIEEAKKAALALVGGALVEALEAVRQEVYVQERAHA